MLLTDQINAGVMKLNATNLIGQKGHRNCNRIWYFYSQSPIADVKVICKSHFISLLRENLW